MGAALRSGLWIGWGQVYNKQLEKAALLWVWSAISLGLGAMLLILGTLGATIPPQFTRPPLGDWIADHSLGVFLTWAVLPLTLWAISIRDAHRSAEEINAGRVVVRYPLRRQLVHVVGSQLLGFLPVVGLFAGPGVVAEAMDSAREKRRPDQRRLVREGAQTLAEWAVTRVALYGLIALAVLWAVWWLLRILRLAP